MAVFPGENSRPVLMSVLLHGGIVAALLLAANFSIRPQLSVQPLPLDATVVDSRIVRAAEHAKRDAALKAEEAAAALQQQQAEKAQQAQQARAAEQAQEAAQARATEQARELAEERATEQARELAEERAAKQAQATRAVEKARAATTAAAAARAEEILAAKRAVQARKAVEAKKAAAAKRAADAKRLADARAAMQADLRRQIAAEEHAEAVQRGPLADQYRASLANRIIHAWIKPPTARKGIDCRVEVTQVPGGEVTSARVTACNGDAAVRQSIENAVYRASPLPDPPDPALFQRVFVFEFKPDE